MTSAFGKIYTEEKGYGVIKKVKRSGIYTVLITVPKEKVIWLTFTKFNVESTSALLKVRKIEIFYF